MQVFVAKFAFTLTEAGQQLFALINQDRKITAARQGMCNV